MFESLTEKLTAVFRLLGNKGRLTEQDVDQALREVRLALLEADVNFKVVKEFIGRVRQRAVGADVLESLNPGQQVVKIVNEELTAILGGGHRQLEPAPQPPSVIMVVGLQGSGKTTTAAKLALHLRKQGHRPLLVAADLRRPAAVEQVLTLGRQLDIPVHSEPPSSTSVKVATNGVSKARQTNSTWVVVDTGGRLHIDDPLMREMEEMKAALRPSEVLLVVDAMTGQDAVNAAQEFHQRLGLTGLILAKLDGDARGGAALSITQVTGVPVKFAGTGERTEALEPFHPDRMASRILGMGDMLSLIEKAQEQMDEKRVQELEQKMRRATFNLDDFLEQLQQLKRMGPLSQVMEMIPGLGALKGRLSPEALEGKQLKKMEAIVSSMTPEERHNPDIIGGSRRRRIALGSGTTPQAVNQLLNQFRQTQRLMKQFASGKRAAFTKLFR